MPSHNPSQSEVPKAAKDAALGVLADMNRDLGDFAGRVDDALTAALPAIRSQIDQEWEERLGEVKAQVDKMGPELEAEFKLRAHEEQEREKAEERLKEVGRQREEQRVDLTTVAGDRRGEAKQYRERAERAEAALSRRDQQVSQLKERVRFLEGECTCD